MHGNDPASSPDRAGSGCPNWREEVHHAFDGDPPQIIDNALRDTLESLTRSEDWRNATISDLFGNLKKFCKLVRTVQMTDPSKLRIKVAQLVTEFRFREVVHADAPPTQEEGPCRADPPRVPAAQAGGIQLRPLTAQGNSRGFKQLQAAQQQAKRSAPNHAQSLQGGAGSTAGPGPSTAMPLAGANAAPGACKACVVCKQQLNAGEGRETEVGSLCEACLEQQGKHGVQPHQQGAKTRGQANGSNRQRPGPGPLPSGGFYGPRTVAPGTRECLDAAFRAEQSQPVHRKQLDLHVSQLSGLGHMPQQPKLKQQPAGMNLQAPILQAPALIFLPARAPAQQVQQPQPAKRPGAVGGARRSSDEGMNANVQGRRQAAVNAEKQIRRSAPPAPNKAKLQEAIDLVDSSDDEAAAAANESAAATAAARTEGAGPGPSSAAAALASPRGRGRPRRGAAAAAAAKAEAAATHPYSSLEEKLKGLKCTFPPEGGKHSVEVVAEDLARLAPREFLNDTCIDFYIKYIEHRLDERRRARYHCFNSFFLKKLQEKQPGAGRVPKAMKERSDHERVKKWTKHVDLFAKDFIFVPIHGYLHWSLILICHPGNVAAGDGGAGSSGAAAAGSPVMLHLDSLDGNHDPPFDALRAYLNHEWQRKAQDANEDSVPRRWTERNPGKDAPKFTKNTLPGLSMTARLPKQDNHTDCGLFLLSYMEFFTSANPQCVVLEGVNAKDVHVLEPSTAAADPATFLTKSWFKKSNTARLRDYLRVLICGLMVERMASDDARRSAAQAVVDDYERRPRELGRCYMPPEEYLRYVREHPDVPDPADDEGVLSDGSNGNEGPYEDAATVIQSPRLTRGAAKKTGAKPTLVGPVAPPAKRRKVQPVPVDAAEPKDGQPVVDLAGSPDKAADAAPQPQPQPQPAQEPAPAAQVEMVGDSDSDVEDAHAGGARVAGAAADGGAAEGPSAAPPGAAEHAVREGNGDLDTEAGAAVGGGDEAAGGDKDGEASRPRKRQKRTGGEAAGIRAHAAAGAAGAPPGQSPQAPNAPSDARPAATATADAPGAEAGPSSAGGAAAAPADPRGAAGAMQGQRREGPASEEDDEDDVPARRGWRRRQARAGQIARGGAIAAREHHEDEGDPEELPGHPRPRSGGSGDQDLGAGRAHEPGPQGPQDEDPDWVQQLQHGGSKRCPIIGDDSSDSDSERERNGAVHGAAAAAGVGTYHGLPPLVMLAEGYHAEDAEGEDEDEDDPYDGCKDDAEESADYYTGNDGFGGEGGVGEEEEGEEECQGREDATGAAEPAAGGGAGYGAAAGGSVPGPGPAVDHSPRAVTGAAAGFAAVDAGLAGPTTSATRRHTWFDDNGSTREKVEPVPATETGAAHATITAAGPSSPSSRPQPSRNHAAITTDYPRKKRSPGPQPPLANAEPAAARPQPLEAAYPSLAASPGPTAQALPAPDPQADHQPRVLPLGGDSWESGHESVDLTEVPTGSPKGDHFEAAERGLGPTDDAQDAPPGPEASRHVCRRRGGYRRDGGPAAADEGDADEAAAATVGQAGGFLPPGGFGVADLFTGRQGADSPGAGIGRSSQSAHHHNRERHGHHGGHSQGGHNHHHMHGGHVNGFHSHGVHSHHHGHGGYSCSGAPGHNHAELSASPYEQGPGNDQGQGQDRRRDHRQPRNRECVQLVQQQRQLRMSPPGPHHEGADRRTTQACVAAALEDGSQGGRAGQRPIRDGAHPPRGEGNANDPRARLHAPSSGQGSAADGAEPQGTATPAAGAPSSPGATKLPRAAQPAGQGPIRCEEGSKAASGAVGDDGGRSRGPRPTAPGSGAATEPVCAPGPASGRPGTDVSQRGHTQEQVADVQTRGAAARAPSSPHVRLAAPLAGEASATADGDSIWGFHYFANTIKALAGDGQKSPKAVVQPKARPNGRLGNLKSGPMAGAFPAVLRCIGPEFTQGGLAAVARGNTPGPTGINPLPRQQPQQQQASQQQQQQQAPQQQQQQQVAVRSAAPSPGLQLPVGSRQARQQSAPYQLSPFQLPPKTGDSDSEERDTGPQQQQAPGQISSGSRKGPGTKDPVPEEPPPQQQQQQQRPPQQQGMHRGPHEQNHSQRQQHQPELEQPAVKLQGSGSGASRSAHGTDGGAPHGGSVQEQHGQSRLKRRPLATQTCSQPKQQQRAPKPSAPAQGPVKQPCATPEGKEGSRSADAEEPGAGAAPVLPPDVADDRPASQPSEAEDQVAGSLVLQLQPESGAPSPSELPAPKAPPVPDYETIHVIDDEEDEEGEERGKVETRSAATAGRRGDGGGGDRDGALTGPSRERIGSNGGASSTARAGHQEALAAKGGAGGGSQSVTPGRPRAGDCRGSLAAGRIFAGAVRGTGMGLKRGGQSSVIENPGETEPGVMQEEGYAAAEDCEEHDWERGKGADGTPHAPGPAAGRGPGAAVANVAAQPRDSPPAAKKGAAVAAEGARPGRPSTDAGVAAPTDGTDGGTRGRGGAATAVAPSGGGVAGGVEEDAIEVSDDDGDSLIDDGGGGGCHAYGGPGSAADGAGAAGSGRKPTPRHAATLDGKRRRMTDASIGEDSKEGEAEEEDDDFDPGRPSGRKRGRDARSYHHDRGHHHDHHRQVRGEHPQKEEQENIDYEDEQEKSYLHPHPQQDHDQRRQQQRQQQQQRHGGPGNRGAAQAGADGRGRGAAGRSKAPARAHTGKSQGPRGPHRKRSSLSDGQQKPRVGRGGGPAAAAGARGTGRGMAGQQQLPYGVLNALQDKSRVQQQQQQKKKKQQHQQDQVPQVDLCVTDDE